MQGSVWWAANLWDAFCHWCVPVFVMISGALLLGDAHRRGAREFWRRRARPWRPMLLPWELAFLAPERGHRTGLVGAHSADRTAPRHTVLPPVVSVDAAGPVLRRPFLCRHIATHSRWQVGLLAALCCALAALEVAALGLLGRSFLTMNWLAYPGHSRSAICCSTQQRLPASHWLWAGFVAGGAGVAASVVLMWPGSARAIEIAYAYPNPPILMMSVCISVSASGRIPASWRVRQICVRAALLSSASI